MPLNVYTEANMLQDVYLLIMQRILLIYEMLKFSFFLMLNFKKLFWKVVLKNNFNKFYIKKHHNIRFILIRENYNKNKKSFLGINFWKK